MAAAGRQHRRYPDRHKFRYPVSVLKKPPKRKLLKM
jgi:hypothetical protein